MNLPLRIPLISGLLAATALLFQRVLQDGRPIVSDSAVNVENSDPVVPAYDGTPNRSMPQ